MKKTLMLGLLLSMGISASAAAVNPFTVSTAGHWSAADRATGGSRDYLRVWQWQFWR